MYKYYYKSSDGKTIQYLGKSQSIPKTCVQISKDEYDNYKSIINSIEDREGYAKAITLYVNGTYDVEYIQENAVHIIDTEEEPEGEEGAP